MVVVVAIAALWGFAEATLFFIVPDVCLTWIAISNLRLALIGCAAAVIGALIGGSCMFLWGRRRPAEAIGAVDRVPGISPELIARIEHELRTRGWLSLVTGSILAVPYKIYAVKSGEQRRSLPFLLLISLFARTLRFVVLVCMTAAISSVLPSGPSIYRQLSLLGIWGVVYVGYFFVRGR